MKKRKVGRPKLADKKLKKKTYIMLGISALLIMILLSGTLVSLNILPNFNKTKGSVPIYKDYELGDMFCLNGEEECFYIISDNGNTVTALAEKNVDTNTNRQSDNANVLIFSGSSYWYNSGLKPEYGTSYPAFVFNENSNLWQPLYNYKNYLVEDLNIKDIEINLMSRTQAVELGCPENSRDSVYCNRGNNPAPAWLYSKSYWYGDVDYRNLIFGMFNDGSLRQLYSYETYNIMGLRPVITIAKSDFAEIIGYEQTEEDIQDENNSSNVSDKTYGVGDLFCLDTECFYTISDNGDTVTGLAQYNLLVGNIVDTDTWEATEILTSVEGYGIQSKNSSGFVDNADTYISIQYLKNYKYDRSGNKIGYWADEDANLLSDYGEDYPALIFDNNSNLWNPIRNYSDYIEGLGYNNIEVTLPTYAQVEKLGCSYDDWSCENAPEWVYQTTYWLSEAEGSGTVYSVGNFDSWRIYDFGYSYIDISSSCGLRPVITISKEDLNKKEEPETTTTEAPTAKKEDVTTTKKKVVTTTTSTTTTTKVEEETTTKQNINKIVSTTKAEVKEETNSPIIPIGLGVAGVGAIGSIIYIYFRKH